VNAGSEDMNVVGWNSHGGYYSALWRINRAAMDDMKYILKKH